MLSIYQNIHFSKTVLMPQERKVHDVKWEKQDTVPYMQSESTVKYLYMEKKRLEENASFGCICFYRMKSQDTEPFCF